MVRLILKGHICSSIGRIGFLAAHETTSTDWLIVVIKILRQIFYKVGEFD